MSAATPRFAKIIDTKANLNVAKRAYPQYEKDLVQAEALYNQLSKQRADLIEARLKTGTPLKTKEAHLPPFLVEPGVHYRQDWQKNKSNAFTLSNGLPNGQLTDFVEFYNTPMGDWDWKDELYHAPGQVTIRHLGDVYDRLERFTTDNPQSVWQTYLTPGGVRAFSLSEHLTPGQFKRAGHFEALKVDPDYEKIALRKAVPRDPNLALLYPKQAWAARISGKPGRAEDFVAFPLSRVGEGLPHPYNERLINTYHDLPIMRSMVNSGMEPYKLPASGLALLEKHLATVPNQHKFSIEQNLEALGII